MTSKSFIMHLDSLAVIDELSDEQAGVLFKAIKSYHEGGEAHLDQVLRIAFLPLKSQFERDKTKYEKICNRNKINGLQGGRPNNPTKPKKPTGFSNNPNNLDNDNDSDNDSKNKKNKTERARLNFLTMPEPWLDWCVAEMKWTREEALTCWPGFYDYWNSTEPKDPRKSDWFMTFKNSCRKGITQPVKHGGNFGRPTKTDRLKQAAQRGFANISGQPRPAEAGGDVNGGIPVPEGLWEGARGN